MIQKSADVRTLLRREESYAVHALLNIAQNPGTNARRIAKDLQMPPAFMAKVLRKLVEAGYINSVMGRKGGVHLSQNLDRLSLLDVIETVSGPVMMDVCQTQSLCATQQRSGHCPLNAVWVSMTLEIRDLLSAIKLGQLLN